MKQVALSVVCVGLLALACTAPAAGTEHVERQLKEIEYCYAVSVLGASTVQLRNQGQALDEQLARRRASLDDAQYALVADVARRVYDDDLADPLAVAGATNAACLQARGQHRAFAPAGQKYCPRVGLMVSEVDRMRRAGRTADETVEALEDRYGNVRTALGESLVQVAAKARTGDTPDSGVLEHRLCMILAIVGG